MRYRRVSYQYTAFVSGGGALGTSESWSARFPLPARVQWRPPVDFYETPSALVVRAEVAGMREEDFEITLYENALVVEGRRSWSAEDHALRFYLAEVRYGAFRFEVPLPTGIDRDRVEAHYAQGFLTVTLPKTTGGVQ